MATTWHRDLIEGRGTLFAVVTTVCISVGGLVEIVPMFSVGDGSVGWEEVTPYSPLEVAGRDIYVREGCVNCHSQMVRPFRDETLRYGPWSRADEFKYDHPFLLGSRRIGPDLQRIGKKYGDAWHFEHMRDPRSVTPGSVMPPYPWLYSHKIDPADIQRSMSALATVGVPYTDADIATAPARMKEQGDKIVASLASGKATAAWDDEIVALIAYLQRLGVDGRKAVEARKGDGAADGGEP
jgi:cytochrome c oxidase cbb3-type subunit I/II